jgi:cardiolipin synthase C
MSAGQLAIVIDEVARALPNSSIAALVRVLAQASAPSPALRLKAVSAVPVAAFASEAGRLVDAWGQGAPEMSGAAIALALEASHQTATSVQSAQTVDIVWTGPTTPQVPVRLTRAVLTEVIRAATAELLIVSFAAYRVQSVLDEIEDAVARGVRIRLLLESVADSGGSLTFDAANAFAAVRDHVSFYVWPADQRPVLGSGVARLHAKGAVADDHTALVTSANITEYAISQNMELGLLIRGGPVPRRLARHFDALVSKGVLVTAK